MKYNTRRLKSAAVKRGKRKNLKNRRKTRRGGTFGKPTKPTTRSDEFADFGTERFHGMLLETLNKPHILIETKNILREIRDTPGESYNWEDVYHKLKRIPGLADINAGSLELGNPDKKYINAVRVLMYNLSPADHDFAFRNPQYAPK